MKVCILSMQQIDNMGSLLQSYALKKSIEAYGNEVEFIDIAKRDEDYELLGNYRQEYHTEREKDGFIGKIRKIDQYALNRLKIKRKSVAQGTVFEEFRKDYLDIEKKSLKYDTCVIGSDEVFNCLNSGEWGFTSQLFGNVPEADKVIFYAASCGSTKYDELPAKVVDKIRETFENVAAFSVRDENTHEFVANLTDKHISDNLDPVLIYNFNHEVEQVSLPEMPEHYCVIYSYYNRIHTAEEIDAIKEFCKKHQLTPVAIGAPQFWIKNYIVCSPFQCLKIFKNADFVITDTFHGTIFSLKMNKRFCTLIRDSNKEKLTSLLKALGQLERIVTAPNEFEKIYNTDISFQNTNTIISQEKENATQYLKCNL